eukprot:2695742-Pleurochrysis_carterae.AAC.1
MTVGHQQHCLFDIHHSSACSQSSVRCGRCGRAPLGGAGKCCACLFPQSWSGASTAREAQLEYRTHNTSRLSFKIIDLSSRITKTTLLYDLDSWTRDLHQLPRREAGVARLGSANRLEPA